MSMPERGSTEEQKLLHQSPEDAADELDGINAALDDEVCRHMRHEIADQQRHRAPRLPYAVAELIESGERGVHALLCKLLHAALTANAAGAGRYADMILQEAAANEREAWQ
jgi:hypothetical protein